MADDLLNDENIPRHGALVQSRAPPSIAEQRDCFVDQERMVPIRKKIVLRQDLADEAGIERLLLAFFEQVHDSTRFARFCRLVRLSTGQT
jgi:hypothetical protein